MFSDKTPCPKSNLINQEWKLVDASNQIVGRIASLIAHYLRGKHSPAYAPHLPGANVVVINAAQVRFTGKKMRNKMYISYTGYPGGQRSTTPKNLLEKHPNRILEHAVRGMLPKNRLGRELFRNLFMYSGAEHPHHGQQPQVIVP